jgi:hypothetical protein
MTRDLIAAEVPEDGVADLGDIFHHLSIAGRLAGFEVAERFYEVGSAEGLRDFEAYLDAS